MTYKLINVVKELRSMASWYLYNKSKCSDMILKVLIFRWSEGLDMQYRGRLKRETETQIIADQNNNI